MQRTYRHLIEVAVALVYGAALIVFLVVVSLALVPAVKTVLSDVSTSGVATVWYTLVLRIANEVGGIALVVVPVLAIALWYSVRRIGVAVPIRHAAQRLLILAIVSLPLAAYFLLFDRPNIN